MGVKVKKHRGAWWIFVHHRGRRWKRRVGKSKRAAEEAAQQIEARLVLGELGAEPPEIKPATPFGSLAEQWLTSEIEGADGSGRSQVRPGTANRYRIQVRVHLIPFLGNTDVKDINPAEVERFYQHCRRSRRPQSPKAIEMALTVLRLILAYSRKLGLVEFNAVTEWRSGRKRGARAHRVPSDKDLNGRTARIRRSLSSGVHLGPTKTGQERIVELSSRLVEVLRANAAHACAASALVFPNSWGGYIHASPFRMRIWRPLVTEAFGPDRKLTPHGLRHTWASLHMARGTPLKWIQAQGDWTTAKLLLDVYGHFLPSEYTRVRGRPFTAR
ncbi:MAG: site-specific integrase [Myxococcota bacterium]|nr:site-specific integrase [Myxococcota bacterium]